MLRQRLTHLVLSWLVIAGLVLGSVVPVAAQEPDGGGALFLPLTANGSAPGPDAQPAMLYRTRVRVPTIAMWRDLEKLGVVVLERGDDWALVFADDAQLESLARLRFNPVETNALPTLLAAAAAAPLTASFAPLLAQVDALGVLAAAQDATGATAARAALRMAMHSLDAMQLTFLAQTAGVDTDADGLTDDQEGFWCTDPARADSDFDGTRDGVEVTALKAWMGNELSKAPGTGKPFQGWPHQKANCFDDDQDSVPDMAEALEVGLSANRESTDRDKFDDGQELFGNTYCPGTSGYCSYGALPRNEDWGVIFAEMPSWVKAPGHHPLVAGFPVPEVDVVESSLRVEVVTTITTDHTVISGTQQSYSTAKTDGVSTSVANTSSWEEWQEVSIATPGQVSSAEVQLVSSDGTWWKFTGRSMELVGGVGAGAALGFCLVPGVGWGTCLGAAAVMGTIGITGIAMDMLGEKLDTQSTNPPNDQSQPQPKCNPSLQTCVNQSKLTPPTTQEIVELKSSTAGTQDQTTNAGTRYSIGNQSNAVAQQVRTIAYPVASPPIPVTTNTRGRSIGGSQTTTNAQYEEHTVTNGEAFSTEESWGTATAVDSAHAADLWFTYKVRNTGTEYAREITNLAFNLYIGDDPNPATTYFVAADIGGAGKFVNFMPAEEHTYTSQRIPLSLEQMKAIDLGGPIRIVVEDFAYGIDELFYQDAANAGVVIAIEDGTDDGDEAIDTYLIPTWGSETVLNVLGRYFPHETDLNGMMTAIWTPEYRTDTPTWCQEPRRPTDQPSTAVWCKHTLSTADWWNVYTDGLGNGSEGFQDTPAAPGATALFRFNQDSDLDGFSDRSEARLGTDAADASSFPRPEVLAGVHNIQVGNKVTSTLSLLNTGLYDAYGVEAVMVAPDDSITIDNNTVGGSGRVKALKQVIVGSRLSLQSPLPAAWTQEGHAVPAPGGYYTGNVDRTYTFTVNCATPGGCTVGAGSWTLDWSDGKGASDRLNVGAGYRSPTFLTVGVLGVTLALYTGNVQHGESFTVAATTPRDTFQYTINRAGHTLPLVIVSYNDPQGNHRFVVPSQAMSLTAPTDNLQPFVGQMLQEVGVEIVTSAPFTPGANSVQLLVNNPADATLQNASLFLEFINISGTVVSEVATPVTLPPGPTYTPVSFNTGSFSPPFDATQDYIVMAFLTDYQGNILDTAGRPLSSFQADPLPKVAVDAATLTWNFGSVPQGALLKHSPALANVGYGRLYTYLTPTPGLSLATRADVVGAADLNDYALILRTADLPVGAYDQTATLKTSDPTQPTLTVHVQGTVTASTGDITIDTGWVSVVQNGGFESGNLVNWQSTDGSNWQAATGPRNTGWISVLQNGGFETGSFSGWQVGSGNWMVELTEDCNSCPYSVPKKGGTNPGWIAQEIDISQYRPLIAIGAGSVDAYGHARTSDGGDKGRVVIQYKAGSTVLATYDSGFRAPGYYWERMQDTRTIPIGTDRIRFEFWLDTDGDGDCKIDTGVVNIRMNYADLARSGSYKLRRNSGASPGSIHQDISLSAWQDLVDQGSGAISISAWLKSIDVNDSVRLQYEFLQTGQIMSGQGYDSNWTRPADWTQYLSEKAIPKYADTVRIILSSSGDADATFDDVSAEVRFRYDGGKLRQLRMPVQTYTHGSLDLGVGGAGQQTLEVSVDVGDDGSLDWTSSISTTLPVRLTTGNVATAINAYLAGKSGLVDVPIRIFVAPDLPVALYDANLTVQPAVDLAAGGLGVSGAVAASGSSAATYLEGDNVPVQATLSNPSSKASGPVTAAFFAAAEGWGDWYIGSVFVANIPAGGSAPVSILWDTTGFNGAVPVKVVVNPYGRTPETSPTNNTATMLVSITPLNPPPAVDFTATPTLGGAPLSVQFTSVITNTVTTYAWNFGDGHVSSAAQPAHSYAAAGVYTVTLTVSGPGGSATKRRSSYITVTNTPTPPVAAFSASPTTGAAPLTVNFANQSTGTITGYTWSFGDGQSSSVANPSHQYAAPGVYTVALTASGPGGSDDEIKTAYITVSVPPAPPVAAFSATPTSGAAPLAVQFTDASTGIVTAWVWSFGDGGQSGEQHPAHTYQAAGVYTATLTVSGPGGGASTAKALRVTPPLPTFTADPPATGGLTVPFTFTPPPGVTHWLWEFGDGQTSTEQNPVHTYAAAGNYTVRLTVYGAGGVGASQELVVTVRAGGQASDGFSLYLPTVRR